ncbi:NAD(P)-binding protein [Cucurbitaria berberidis CBS 394.84]|uniref:NAD(P)-binding protein n=1 Tax=Cucurbitaria berberidis CBS 394.84 TaxID=1168544 RepID=A0A9P4L6H0_9PLEO|nr:NAD(P)-binding protein [Cucurbitaria berberidis CBS 394.84]KAF1843289.1 NAD(P)-binding protein [Cucurbitaria berberidis CBS 394.84]
MLIDDQLTKVPVPTSGAKGMTVFEAQDGLCNILITGGGGFIGSQLAYDLAETYPDYRVVVFDLFNYKGSLNNLNSHVHNLSIFKGDIFNDEDLSTALMAYSIDAVIHLSAQTSVDASLATPYESARANVVGTNVVLENCLKHGVKKFVHMSSAEVYGKADVGEEGVFREDVSPRPVNPYGASKAASEMIVHGYQNRGIDTFIVRASNVYGPKQFPDKLIPRSVTLLQHGEKVTIHGTGEDVKHWLYISDVSNAFNVILHRGVPGEVYNLGSHYASTNYNLCSSIIKAITGAPDIEQWMNKVPGRAVVGKPVGLGFSKLEGIGWTQKVALEEGVEETVKWYRDNAEKWWGNLPGILGIPPRKSC